VDILGAKASAPILYCCLLGGDDGIWSCWLVPEINGKFLLKSV
jgi:hypothetical protein